MIGITMPQMADIVVKKYDNATNITYTNMQPSGGDKTPAVWRSNSVGTSAAQRPSMTIASQPNGPRTARRVTGKTTYPALVTGTDGKVSVTDTALFSFDAVVPANMADTDLNEWAAQTGNLIASALVRDCLRSGFSPT